MTAFTLSAPLRRTPRTRFGLLLGDVVHNYRSCLDHLAWALYKRGGSPPLPPAKEKLVAFPITSKRKTFNDSLNTKLPGVGRTDRAIIRRYQPFKFGERNVHRHVFTVLRDFSDRDKHRTIQPVFGAAESVTFGNLGDLTNCTLTRSTLGRGYDGTLKPDSELARFYVRRIDRNGPVPDINVQPHFTLVPAVMDRLTLPEFLQYTMNITAVVLSEFSEPSESVLNMLAGHDRATPVFEERRA